MLKTYQENKCQVAPLPALEQQSRCWRNETGGWWVLKTNFVDWGGLPGLITSLPSVLLTAFPLLLRPVPNCKPLPPNCFLFPRSIGILYSWLKRECFTVKLTEYLLGWRILSQTLASFSLERLKAKIERDFFIPSTLCLHRLQCHLKKISDFRWQAKSGQARTSKH